METKDKLMKAGVVFLGVLSLLAVVKIFSEIRAYRFIGSDPSRVATITVQGSAEKMVAPDVARLSFGVMSEAVDLPTAQSDAAKKNNAVIEYLTSAGIDKKDIQSNLSFYPRYGEQARTNCFALPCPVNQVIIGFTASYQLQVTVHELAKVGELVAGVTKQGITNFNGPNFSVEDEESYKADIRAEAIAEAEAKAKRLAKDLGVRLVRVIDFNEAGGPIYYGKAMSFESYGMGGDSAVPEVLPGENQVVSNISITYEVR